MARNARSIRDVVVVVDVAVGARARGNRVRSGQGERRFRVVETCRLPRRSRVAEFASLGKAPGHVVRILRSLVIRQVAGYAGCVGQVVVVLLVAIGALPRGHGVHSRQGEAGGAVIELGIRPRRRVMTLFAGGRETGVRHGTGRTVEIFLVARNASSIRDVVVVVDVAVRARAAGAPCAFPLM